MDDTEAEKDDSQTLVKVRRLTTISIGLLVLALFVPWWRVTIGPQPATPISGFEPIGDFYFLPAWSAFAHSKLGVMLTLHFRNLFVMLIGSLFLTALSRSMYQRRPWLSPPLMWGATSFSLVGLLLFSLLFPPFGSLGRVFWPAGAQTIDSWYYVEYSWLIMPGFFLALFALALQVHLAFRLAHQDVQQRMMSLTRPRLATPAFFTERSLHKRLVFPMVFIVASASIWAGLSYYPTVSAIGFRPYLDYGYRSFSDGDAIVLTGTVTNSTLFRTSYGIYTMVALDGQEFLIALEGDRRSSYPVGSRASIPMHFRTYTYNEIEYIWSDVGMAPLPMMYSVSIVIGDVSHAMGALIAPDEGDLGGTSLEVLLPRGLPIEEFNLSLYKVEGPFYLGESSVIGTHYASGAIDRLEPLAPGASDQGMMTFTDTNNNGLLDWGDHIELNIPPAEKETQFQSYMLGLYGPVRGVAYVVVGHNGPLLFYPEERHWWTYTYLDMPPDSVNGNRCSSRLEVDQKTGADVSVTEYSLSLDGEEHERLFSLPAETQEYTFGDESVLRFEDFGEGGVLDIGDAWILENLTTGSFYEMTLRDELTGRSSSATWVCGLGMNIAHKPDVVLSSPSVDPIDPNRYLINVTSVDWVPAGLLREYRAVLMKDDAPLLPLSGDTARLVPLTSLGWEGEALPLGPSDDGAGTWLSFNDSDANGVLSSGDFFAVNNTAPQSQYKLLLYYADDHHPIVSVTWFT